MPDQKFSNIELPPKHFEELDALAKNVQEKHIDYSERGVERKRGEILKEVITEKFSPKIASAKTVVADDDVARIKSAEKSKKLQELVNFAAEHGPVKASLLAKRSGDPWLEDEFHDALIRFHDELVNRGKLKEE